MADRQKKPKERKLSEAEKRRLENFRTKTAELQTEGYSETDLTVGLVRGNVQGSIYGILLSIPFIIVYIILVVGRGFEIGGLTTTKYLLFMVSLIAAIVVHELIHGLFFGLFAKGGLKSIEFGVIWQSLNPYCYCKEPLTKPQYLTALIMPCIILGFIPSIIAWFNHSLFLMFFGVIMIMSAGGDLLIGQLILSNPTKSESLYLDHPTTIGVIRFERFTVTER